MFAIIDDRGRQHLVEEGQKVYIDRYEGEPGTQIVFDRVLLVGGRDGGASVGQPVVSGAQVTAEVVAQKKGPKIHVQTYKRRKNYKRHIGHRQQMTEVTIKSITA